MKKYLSSGAEMDITINETGGYDVKIVGQHKTFGNIDEAIPVIYGDTLEVYNALKAEGILTDGDYSGIKVVNSEKNSNNLQQNANKLKSGPPPITGKEMDGDVSDDGNYAFECGNPNAKNEVKRTDRWVKTKDWIKDKYNIQPYAGYPYKHEYIEYLESSKYSNYLQNEFSKLGKQYGISGYELYTIAIAEGLADIFDDNEGRNVNLESIVINGFDTLGIDNFGSDANKFKKEGLLPNDFKEGIQYKIADRTNEELKTVHTGDFYGITNALTAFAAVYADRRLQVLEDGKNFGYQDPSEDQIRFWTYLYFNPGQKESGFTQLKKNGSFDFTGMKFDNYDPHPSGVHSKAYKRVATEKYLEKKGTGLIK